MRILTFVFCCLLLLLSCGEKEKTIDDSTLYDFANNEKINNAFYDAYYKASELGKLERFIDTMVSNGYEEKLKEINVRDKLIEFLLERIDTEERIKDTMNNILLYEVIKKEYNPQNNNLVLTSRFINKSQKSIYLGFGNLTIYDKFNKEIEKIRNIYSQHLIKPLDTLEQTNKFNIKHRKANIKLENSSLENLKFKFKVNSIYFNNGDTYYYKDDYIPTHEFTGTVKEMKENLKKLKRLLKTTPE